MTKIEWTQRPGTKGETWNPIVGCSLATPGCTNCYAMGEAARQIRCAAGLNRATHYEGTVKTVKGKAVWTGEVKIAPDHILLKPLSWSKPRTVFVNSMGDLFHENVPDAWIDKVVAVMALCPLHTFQVLTKRAERMRAYFSRAGLLNTINGHKWSLLGTPLASKIEHGGRWMTPALPLPNVWLGVSTERQQEAYDRIPDLLQTPAAVRFISAEPLLGPIDLTNLGDATMSLNAFTGEASHLLGMRGKTLGNLDQVIVGGESGDNARPMHPDWVRSLRDQCAAAGVAFFFKQWGAYWPGEFVERGADGEVWRTDPRGGKCWHFDEFNAPDPFERIRFQNLGKKTAGRLLDGREHNEWPKEAA